MNNPFDDVNPEDDPPVRTAPWEPLIDYQKDGPFADFAAWERWVGANHDGDPLADLDTADRVGWYDLFCKAVAGVTT